MVSRTASEGCDVCVLLVEDEPLIREIMSEGLQDAGFDVVEAENGEAALALIRDGADRFSALVTDFHMPGRHDGASVASCIRAHSPGIPVVIATGRPEVFQTSWRDEDGYRFLRKPYTVTELIGLLTQVLHACAGGPA